MSAASKRDAVEACAECICPSWWGRVEYKRGCYKQAQASYADVMIRRDKEHGPRDYLEMDARGRTWYEGHSQPDYTGHTVAQKEKE